LTPDRKAEGKKMREAVQKGFRQMGVTLRMAGLLMTLPSMFGNFVGGGTGQWWE
tara:strand:+ start:362 stop:523 length:162 start_codon:yes stop_codon:yes gene_type:complete